MELGKANGLKQAEMVEILTQLAFYIGWPNAWSTFNIAKEVYSNQRVQGERHD